MAATKPLRAGFHGTPGPTDRAVLGAASAAARSADEKDPVEIPDELPKTTYSSAKEDRQRRVEILDRRTKDLEDQRLNAEIDFDSVLAQIESLRAVGGAEDQVKQWLETKKRLYVTVVAADAALAKLRKRRV